MLKLRARDAFCLQQSGQRCLGTCLEQALAMGLFAARWVHSNCKQEDQHGSSKDFLPKLRQC